MENQKRGPPPPMKLVTEVRRCSVPFSFVPPSGAPSITLRTTCSALIAVSLVALKGTSLGSQMSRENQYWTSSGKNCDLSCEAAKPPINKNTKDPARTDQRC